MFFDKKNLGPVVGEKYLEINLKILTFSSYIKFPYQIFSAEK
jgi:hypothetical protein